jgi:hypothetical protein
VRVPLIVMAVAFLFLGGLFVVLGGRSLLDAWRYRDAVQTDAVTTATALRPATDTSDTEYEVSFRATIDGQVYDRTEMVAARVWERSQIGSPVQVEYLRGRPDTVRVKTGTGELDRQSFLFAPIGALLLIAAGAAMTRAFRRRPANEAISARPPVAVPASYWMLARQSSDFWLGAFALVVASPMVVAALLQAREEWRFARHGVSTDGLVLTKEIKRSGRGQRSRTYEATYRLTVPEGAFENRVDVSFDTWSRLQERRTVEVLYLPDRPAQNRLKESKQWTGSAAIGLIGVAFFGMGATFFSRSVWRARLEWRLLQHGAAASGTVVEISDRRLKTNGVRQFRLRYEYVDVQSRRHSGTHDLPEDEAMLWNVGDAVAVRYDPARPGDSIWVGRGWSL